MPRTRNPYPAEFREQIIALAKAGRSVESLAREFEPCVATIQKQLSILALRRHSGSAFQTCSSKRQLNYKSTIARADTRFQSIRAQRQGHDDRDEYKRDNG